MIAGDDFDRLVHSLTNHPPVDESVVERFEAIRAQAIALGETILELAPQCRERSVAIEKLEETVMWAIKSIAVNQDAL